MAPIINPNPVPVKKDLVFLLCSFLMLLFKIAILFSFKIFIESQSLKFNSKSCVFSVLIRFIDFSDKICSFSFSFSINKESLYSLYILPCSSSNKVFCVCFNERATIVSPSITNFFCEKLNCTIERQNANTRIILFIFLLKLL